MQDVPDFPSPGILFRDITPLLANADAYRFATEALADRFVAQDIDVVVGIEARGFLMGAPVACRLGCGFVPLRKPGRLPPPTISVNYELEYGTDCIEMRSGTLAEGAKVLVVDDVLATGGTASAACELLGKAGADVAGAAFLIELTDLGGRDRLGGIEPHVVLTY